MKGAKEVIAVLNDALGAELVAINQYFLHAKMCQNWGFMALAKKVREESIDEMRHAETLIDRILFLEGVPNLQKLGPLQIGQTVVEQFKADLELEYVAVKRLRAGIATCRTKADSTSEMILVKILEAEETHIDWLEAQLGLVDQIGEKAYLAEQLRG